MYIFPFECVRKGEKILIYGYGRVGQDYEKQMALTSYCSIEAFVDNNASVLKSEDTDVISVEDIYKYEYEHIIIAILKEEIRTEIYELLLAKGIKEEFIINYEIKEITDKLKPCIVPPVNDNKIHIGLLNLGGLGDTVMDIVLIQKLRELFGQKIVLTPITRYGEIFQGNTLIDFIEEENNSDLDILIQNRHCSTILYWAPEKIKNILPKFYKFCIDSIFFIGNTLNGSRNTKDVLAYARFLNRSRVEACDITNSLGITRNDKVLFNWNSDSKEVLEKFGLFEKEYIVFNRDVDTKQNSTHPKLWTIESYNRLIELIKIQFPNLCLVKVGAREVEGGIRGIDIDLSEMTSLEEIKIILKNAMTLVSSEGGLVHTNHFLYGRSVVVFGPTDENYFGYDQDIICINRECCNTPCSYLESRWPNECLKGMNPAGCMMAVSPEMVLEKMQPFIEKQIATKMKVEYIDIHCKEEWTLPHLSKIAVVGDIIGWLEKDIISKIKEAKHYQEGNPYSPESFLGNLPEYEACYELIILGECVLKDKYAIIKECFRLLKTEGRMLINRKMADGVLLTPDSAHGDCIIVKKVKD